MSFIQIKIFSICRLPLARHIESIILKLSDFVRTTLVDFQNEPRKNSLS